MIENKPKIHELTPEQLADKFTVNGEFQAEKLSDSAKGSFLSASQNLLAGILKLFALLLFFIRYINKIPDLEKRVDLLEKKGQNILAENPATEIQQTKSF